MGNNVDIYNLSHRIDYYCRRVTADSEVCEENKAVIERFLNICRAQGLSNARTSIYLIRLYFMAKWLRKPYLTATKDDLQALMARIEQENLSAGYKQMFRVTLKKFYKELEGNGETYPDKVRWLKTSKKVANHLLPEELLTPEEIKRLIEAAEHPRDKAFVAVLYESGCRVGEIAGLKIKHVSYDSYGGQIIVNGKTGMRRVRLVTAVHYLNYWLELHPQKGDPEAPLWPRLTTRNKGEPMAYANINVCLKRLAKRAKVTKRVNPHVFRHSRATYMAKAGMTEVQLRAQFGWAKGSDTPDTYVHLSGADLDDAVLRSYGIIRTDSNPNNIPCPRCTRPNDMTARFCKHCGFILTAKAAVEVEDKRLEFEKKVAPLMELLEDSSIREFLSGKLKGNPEISH